MDFLEKTLEDIIFETPNDLLHERGLYIHGNKKRQLRIGNYGISDIVTYYRYDGKLFINILELKKDKISTDTLLQAVGYVKGIRSYLMRRKPTLTNISFKIKLIGKEIDTSDSFCYLPDIFTGIEIITYSYGFDGIHFKYHYEYKLTNEGFGLLSEKIENSNITKNEPF